MKDPDVFYLIVNCLREARGEARAWTLKSLATVCGVSRRRVEKCIEEDLENFPFVVVSGSEGYFRPVNADQVNHYQAALNSRIRKLAIRKRAVRRLASESGFVRDGKRFMDPPSSQPEFDFCSKTQTRMEVPHGSENET